MALGNAKLMADLGIKFGDLDRRADELRGDGATALFLAIDDKPGGVIAIADPIKSTTQAALETLRNDGLRIVMLTGDNKTTAEAVARKLGIKEIEADVLPQDKNRIVKKLTAEGRIVAMAGDGVNDAPALAEAAVGIAMGTGTEVAIQSAGITLVKGDLAGIARAIVLSRATMRNIRENLIFAFAYNAIGADSDEAGQAFRQEAGHRFRFEAGRDSDLISATWRLLPRIHAMMFCPEPLVKRAWFGCPQELE